MKDDAVFEATDLTFAMALWVLRMTASMAILLACDVMVMERWVQRPDGETR